MEAFLLLDEQNLKDIGVSTMGARKKIYNAILSELFQERVFYSSNAILYKLLLYFYLNVKPL